MTTIHPDTFAGEKRKDIQREYNYAVLSRNCKAIIYNRTLRDKFIYASYDIGVR